MVIKSLNIRNKCSLAIVAGFSTILSLIIVVMIVALDLIGSIDDKLKQVVHEHIQQVVLANKMIYLGRERSMLLHEMVSTDDPFKRDEQFLKVREIGAEFIKARQAMLTLNLWPDEQDLLEQQGQLTRIATEYQDRIIELAQQGRLHEAHEVLTKQAIIAQNEVIKVLLQFADLQYLHNQQALEASEMAYDDAVEIIVGLIILVVMMGIFIAVFVVRRITLINNDMHRSAEHLAITNKILSDNIEDLNQVTEELAKSESQERAIRENMLDAVVTINSDGVIASCNPAAEKMFGYPVGDMLGQNVSLLMPEPYRSHHDHYIDAFKNNRGDRVIGMVRDLEGQRKDGSTFPMDISVTKLLLDDEYVLVGIMRDITERKQAEDTLKRSNDELEQMVTVRTEELQRVNKRLEQMASHDSLTGLPNRVLMKDHLKQMIAHAHRSQQPLAVLFLDLDGFKQVNDTLGHEVGDHLLIEVATRMKNCMREEDVVARIGGDEFVIISAELHDKHNADDLADRIIRAVGLPVDLQGQQANVGVSIGISCFPGDSEDADELIKFADQAMYQAKNTGKNKFSFYTDD
ncbi:MAG: diguanylate cyclase [Gammaproteobacteria bacterium]|nr:diguanylate cyclase [Gammaproteobacteria bacterium]